MANTPTLITASLSPFRVIDNSSNSAPAMVTANISPFQTVSNTSTNTSSPAQNTAAAQTSSQPSNGASFNAMDRNANPGEGYFYDAADGWKKIQSDADAERAAYEARLRGEINAGWDQVDNGLNNIAGRLPTQRDNQNTQIENLYGTSSGKLAAARDYANSQIDANQKTTLNALSEQLRNAMQAGNTYLGARGASNSSAADRYAVALAKQANNQAGSVMTQSDAQRAAVQNTYDNNIASLEDWRNTKLYEVAQWYEEQMNTLDMERANASGQRAQALANLTAQLHTAALQRVQEIQAQADAYKQTVDAWMFEQQNNISTGVNTINQTPIMPTYSDLENIVTTGGTQTPIVGGGVSSDDDNDPNSLTSIYARLNATSPRNYLGNTYATAYVPNY